MKKIYLLIFLSVISFTFGQSAKEYLDSGIALQDQKDFKGALKEYSKGIKLDKTNPYLYFNKGTCELALQNYKSAMQDFNKAIDLEPNFSKAYYNRASVFVSQEKYKEALPDLDKTIELEANFPNALTLRGQIRAQTGNEKGACEDFNLAKEYGDKLAVKYLNIYCNNASDVNETIFLNLPKDENWIVGSNQDAESINVIDYIHPNETLQNWTELVNSTKIKNVTGVTLEKITGMLFQQSKKNAPKAKFTLIEKDDTSEYPWALFTIESPSFKNDSTPESQLWYVVIGKNSIFTNFIALKKAKLPQDFIQKWTKIFKSSKIETK